MEIAIMLLSASIEIFVFFFCTLHIQQHIFGSCVINKLLQGAIKNRRSYRLHKETYLLR